jgi:transposase
MVSLKPPSKEPSMVEISRIGMDTSKRFFQLHGVNAAEAVVVRRKLSRDQMVTFFTKLTPTVIGIEACGAGHFWARELGKLGHTVKLIAPQLAKPYVKRNKNDAADAEALCEAMSRPSMRFVPGKSAEQQAALMLVQERERHIRERTRLGNTIRGYAAEFGLVANKGLSHIAVLLQQVKDSPSIPGLAGALMAELGEQFFEADKRVDALDAKLKAWHRENETSRRLAKVPGIGETIAPILVMKVPDAAAFKSGRDFAAWLGLTPKDHSTGGKTRLGRITRAGDETLRSLLVVGATAVIWHARRAKQPNPWLLALLARKPAKLAAVALANKMARIAWKLMVSGQTYTDALARPVAAAATA